MAGDSAVIERIIVGIWREGTEIVCLDLDSCLSQQVEEASYGVHRHLESTQDSAIFLQDGRAKQPVKLCRTVDPAQEQSQLWSRGDWWVLAEGPCPTDHNHGIDHPSNTPPAGHY
jgi:hypothetical protein